MAEIQPIDLTHGKRYTIKCFHSDPAHKVVVELSGTFVTSYLFGVGGVADEPAIIHLGDTNGGRRYIFEHLKFKRGSPREVRDFFVERMEFTTSFFRVPCITHSPLDTDELMTTNPHRENVMICSDTHIYNTDEDRLELDISARTGARPMRFYDDFVRKIFQKPRVTAKVRDDTKEFGRLPALPPSTIEHIESYLYKKPNRGGRRSRGTIRRRHR